MTLEELVTKVKSLEEQVINLATRQSNRSADADSGISEAKAKTEEVKRESESNMSDGWNAKVFYHKDDYCLHNNTLWVAKFDNIGVEPSDSTYWDRKNLSDAIAVLGESVADGKAQIASAITDKGVETSADSEFKVMADNIESIITNPEITIDDLSDELLSEIYNSITVDDIPEDIKKQISGNEQVTPIDTTPSSFSKWHDNIATYYVRNKGLTAFNNLPLPSSFDSTDLEFLHFAYACMICKTSETAGFKAAFKYSIDYGTPMYNYYSNLQDMGSMLIVYGYNGTPQRFTYDYKVIKHFVGYIAKLVKDVNIECYNAIMEATLPF